MMEKAFNWLFDILFEVELYIHTPYVSTDLTLSKAERRSLQKLPLPG